MPQSFLGTPDCLCLNHLTEPQSFLGTRSFLCLHHLAKPQSFLGTPSPPLQQGKQHFFHVKVLEFGFAIGVLAARSGSNLFLLFLFLFHSSLFLPYFVHMLYLSFSSPRTNHYKIKTSSPKTQTSNYNLKCQNKHCQKRALYSCNLGRKNSDANSRQNKHSQNGSLHSCNKHPTCIVKRLYIYS